MWSRRRRRSYPRTLHPVLHREHPEPQHPDGLRLGRPAVLQLVRTAGLGVGRYQASDRSKNGCAAASTAPCANLPTDGVRIWITRQLRIVQPATRVSSSQLVAPRLLQFLLGDNFQQGQAIRLSKLRAPRPAPLAPPPRLGQNINPGLYS
jgi:hypothetical protein